VHGALGGTDSLFRPSGNWFVCHCWLVQQCDVTRGFKTLLGKPAVAPRFGGKKWLSRLALFTDTIHRSVKVWTLFRAGIGMRRLAGWIAIVALASSAGGCCASPYRFYQNAYGWNDPVPDHYVDAPPAPRTTPPGRTMPAVEAISSTVAR
jgi:hypothetical protein